MHPQIKTYILFFSLLIASSLFSQEEQKRVVHIGLHKEWMPISGLDENGNVKGLVKEYIELIEKRSDLKLVVQNSTFNEAVALMKKGVLDILVGDLNDLNLKKEYLALYTHNIPVVLLMHAKKKHVDSLLELQGKRVAIEKSALYKDRFYEEYPTLKFVEIDSLEDAIVGVYDGRYDALLSTTLQIDYELLDLGLSNFHIVATTTEFLKLTMFVHKNDKELIAILSDIFANISTNTKHEINKKYTTTNFVEHVDYTIAFIVAFFSLIIVTSLLYYSKMIRKEAEKRELAEEEAKRANAMKSLFLANMSHEIRTPMNSIIGFTELLEETPLNAKQKKYLSSIKSGGKALLTLINDILDISKIEAGRFELEKMPVNVDRLIAEVDILFREKIEAKGLAFTVEIDNKIEMDFISDGVRIRQILINLLSNAIKFTQEGSITLRVRQKSDSEMLIYVEDSGVGISQEAQEYIFDAFTQQLGQSNKRYGGTGLGLSISRKLAHLLGGTLSCESKKGEGALFILHLKNLSFISKQRSPKKHQNEHISFTPCDILVVDDSSENLLLLESRLGGLGFRTTVAHNGIEALREIEKREFCMLLTDIRMPKMDGVSLLKRVRSDCRYENLPIIALTASVMKEERDLFLAKGFDAILEKPLDFGQLKQRLQQFLEYRVEQEVLEDKKCVKSEVQLKFVSKALFEKFELSVKSGMIESLKDFAYFCEQSAKDREDSALEEFAVALLKSIDTFDIVRMESLKKKFKAAEVIDA